MGVLNGRLVESSRQCGRPSDHLAISKRPVAGFRQRQEGLDSLPRSGLTPAYEYSPEDMPVANE
jgi:hypothetical protein